MHAAAVSAEADSLLLRRSVEAAVAAASADLDGLHTCMGLRVSTVMAGLQRLELQVCLETL